MTGYEIPEDLSEIMLESFAGGIIFHLEALSLGDKIKKARKHTIPSLKNLLWNKT